MQIYIAVYFYYTQFYLEILVISFELALLISTHALVI